MPSNTRESSVGHLRVDEELVHAAGPQRGPDGVHHHGAGIDVAHHLPLTLAGVCALLEQHDLRLLRGGKDGELGQL